MPWSCTETGSDAQIFTSLMIYFGLAARLANHFPCVGAVCRLGSSAGPAPRDVEGFATPDGLVPFKRAIVQLPGPALALLGTSIPWGRGEGSGSSATTPQPPHAASCIPLDRAGMCSCGRDLLGMVCW